MKYLVTIGEHTVEVLVQGGGVTVDGTAIEAHMVAVPGTPLYHLLLDGASWTVAAEALAGLTEGGGQRWALGAAGERVEVAVVDERTREIQSFTGRRATPDGAAVLRAPMPGMVVRVQVVPGQQVEAGAGLVVVEAMKMENELRATRAGTVGAVHVRPGQAVEKGAPLIRLD